MPCRQHEIVGGIAVENYIRYRRDLHQIPEVGRKEEQTGRYIAEHLAKLDCLVERVVGTGSIAFFDNGAGRALAFRADIDALPIAEQTGLDFASHNGCMHACGHDAHMAMLLALADYLHAHKSQYNMDVLLIFQPSEETIGGAKHICEQGILDRFHVEKVFGLHVWPKAKAGTLSSRPGPLMAQAAELFLTVHGKSAHCARPDLGIDALGALADIVSELNRYKREDVAPGTEFLLHIGAVAAGDANNIVCETAQAKGSVRAFEPAVFDMLCEKIHSTVKQADERWGTRTEVHIGDAYPPVTNDPALYTEYQKAMEKAGVPLLEAEKTVIGEDFSEYQKRVPGVFAFLGLGDVPSLHNNRFQFDESLMETGIRAFIGLLDYFAR